jgi:hypothetical protein
MIDKKNLIALEWKTVEKYLKKDNSESSRLAVIEAENVFLRVVERKGYKAKSLEGKVSLALKEIRNPETLLKARDKALEAKNKVGFDFDDPYTAGDIINIYKESIEYLLFGIIEEKKFESLKYRFWRYYYVFFINRRKIYRFLVWVLIFILIMLFIADTDLGKSIFDYFIDKIHLILRIILFALFIVFSILFFVTFSIILLESRSKKRYQRRSGAVDK